MYDDENDRYDFGPVPTTMQDIFAAQQNLIQQQAALEQQRYEEGRRRIEQMQLAPSRSEQLMQLSQALLSPSPYRNRTKGMLANLSRAMGPMAGAERQAELERARMLRELSQGYQDKQMDSRQRQLGLAQAYARAMTPEYQWDTTTGRWMVVPNTGGMPHLASGAPAQGTLPDGRPVTQNPDGTLTATNADGSTTRYDSNGNPI